MRLTLRTLLAYLDRILDEEDTRELDNKIQDSEVANQLVHRIRKVLSQRRSESLAVDVQGVGQDANSVAEYLDNTLPAEQVPNFERVCLDSDTHLAEVAACHQILTLVLGEPAEVPNELKQRMYRLRDGASASPVSPGAPTTGPAAPHYVESGDTTHRIDPQPVNSQPANSQPTNSQAASPQGSDAVAAPVTAASKSQPAWDQDERWTEAPDYLKRPRPGRWKPVVLATLIAFCLAMAAIFSRPLDQTHPLASLLGLSDVAPGGNELVVEDPDPLPAGSPQPLSPSDERREGTSPTTAGGDNGTSDGTEIARDDLAAPQDQRANEPIENGDESLPRETELTLDPPRQDDLVPLDDADLPATGDTTTADFNSSDDLSIPDDFPGPESDVAIPFEESGVNQLAADGSTGREIEGGSADFEPLPAVGGSNGNEAGGNIAAAAPASPNTADDFPPVAGDALTFPDAGSEIDDRAQPPTPPTIINPLAVNDNDGAANGPVGLVPVLPNASRTIDDVPEPIEESTEPAKPPVTDVGRFLDEQQVLIRLDRTDNSWQRVKSGDPLQIGNQLVSLPTYRTPLALGSGMQVSMVGATKLELLPTDDEQAPIFGVEYGRLVVATFTQTGNTFGIRWGASNAAELTVTDMNTNFAVEVQRSLLPGSDPEADKGYNTLVLYVTSGGVEWQSGDDPPIQITTDRRLAVVDSRVPILTDTEELPGWIDGSDAAPRDPVAAAGMSKRLGTDRPVTLVLLEEADDNSRYRDVRSLAVCGLAQFGQYNPLLVALNDPEQRAYWKSQYDVLSQLVHRSPETATAVKQALIEYHDEEQGESLFRALSGYSPIQLENGGAQGLVDLLDHSETHFRLISSEMLKEITGTKSLYRAHASERNPQRRAATNRWKKLLKEGKIVYAEKPLVVQLLAAPAASDATGE